MLEVFWFLSRGAKNKASLTLRLKKLSNMVTAFFSRNWPVISELSLRAAETAIYELSLSPIAWTRSFRTASYAVTPAAGS
ncbi:hypothetical protein SAY87_015510 [Trapa incisa]|uniref:Uncharacterized protein n=1 Tax=Trapa incisa TaxID=236973 RepID=A0AAN7GUD4_9MYRT|nr:hypothetical protein SAY87_015510 [Trapa incisa]